MARNTSEVEEHARASGWGLGRVTSESIIHTDLHKPNNKMVNAQLEHFWCIDEPRANTNSQDSPRPRLKGSHHLPPYSIIGAYTRGLHPNVILFQDSQVASPKGTHATLKAHNFLCRLSIELKFQAKLQPLLTSFQGYATCHLHISKSRWFATFNSWESNWLFDFRPFFWS